MAVKKSPGGLDKLKRLGEQVAEVMDGGKRNTEVKRIRRSPAGGVRG